MHSKPMFFWDGNTGSGNIDVRTKIPEERHTWETPSHDPGTERAAGHFRLPAEEQARR